MIPRLFGTNGIRGVVGQDMTVDLALRVGKSEEAARYVDVAARQREGIRLRHVHDIN